MNKKTYDNWIYIESIGNLSNIIQVKFIFIFFDLEVFYHGVYSKRFFRRENIEFHNVPESIDQKSLEKHILAVLESINIQLQHYDIVAVHRIGKIIHGKNRKVLVRFINRKNAFRCLKNSRKLKHSTNIMFKSYFITENLCPDNRQIFNRCYKLKKHGDIYNVWTYNGAVFFKFSENEDVISIKHFDDIEWYIDERANSFSDSDGD